MAECPRDPVHSFNELAAAIRSVRALQRLYDPDDEGTHGALRRIRAALHWKLFDAMDDLEGGV